MNKLLLSFLTASLAALSTQAQVLAPVDTSFTINSVYQKNIKHYPNIKVIAPELDKSTKADLNQPFCVTPTSTLYADVFYPKKKKRRPAIMMIHGGGWRSGTRSMEIPLAQKLAAKGYVTFCVDYRMSTEALYPAAIYDVKAAVRWIKSKAALYGVDTNKIAVLGCSAGGQLATLLGTTNNNPEFEDAACNATQTATVAAIIDVDGTLAFIHPESGEGADKPGKPSAATLWLGASATEKPELWQKVAALNHTGAHTPPILFINSSIPRMHAGRNDMIAILNKYNIYNEVHTFDDAPHPFWLLAPWFDPTVTYIDAFMKKVFP